MTFPFGISTTWVERVKGPPDSFGNDTWTTVETVVPAQAFDPGVSVEQIQGQDLVITQPTVYYPPGTVPASVDAIRIDGATYEVDGSPNAPQSPFTGVKPGVVVRLRKATG